ncbi:DUF2442 domain-containing protein [Silvibacterium dinghuense]|uniref:DUF2442 domain-containing protein n=1 Tax=Silvibacterium dinghuense TaxID=1560006 RepID=A0A4Q1SKL7_9BACT|nr:DUF2442 domain-containing protein [Silvibacterium dinghuense]RXS98017.1 DUF2442 domain-containing protein [Silvibacterium dinghuense]GGH03856.1 hypothetical protein GCM10011586_19800 [Silvibacterium dinghuense]
MVTHEEYVKANERAKALEVRVPKAVSASYDRRLRRVIVQLNSNLGIFFSPRDAEGLEYATPEQLHEIEISPSGYGLHFPRIDADLYLPSLLEGIFGSERWVAGSMGKRGGRSRSAAKVRAARENGKKGGRPKQKEAAQAELV